MSFSHFLDGFKMGFSVVFFACITLNTGETFASNKEIKYMRKEFIHAIYRFI